VTGEYCCRESEGIWRGSVKVWESFLLFFFSFSTFLRSIFAALPFVSLFRRPLPLLSPFHPDSFLFLIDAHVWSTSLSL
jgi:hypothetical protein